VFLFCQVHKGRRGGSVLGHQPYRPAQEKKQPRGKKRKRGQRGGKESGLLPGMGRGEEQSRRMVSVWEAAEKWGCSYDWRRKESRAKERCGARVFFEEGGGKKEGERRWVTSRYYNPKGNLINSEGKRKLEKRRLQKKKRGRRIGFLILFAIMERWKGD